MSEHPNGSGRSKKLHSSTVAGSPSNPSLSSVSHSNSLESFHSLSALLPSETLGDVCKRTLSVEKSNTVIVTFSLQDFFKSHLRHFVDLAFAIKHRFGHRVEVRRIESRSSGAFEVYMSIASAPKSERLIFSRIIEGFLPPAAALLPVIERALADRRVEERRLGKVHCCFIYSDQEQAGLFKRLVNQATSQLIDRIKFEIQMVPIRDVLEIWVNGQLIYSLWYCGQAPVLQDIIKELQKASLGQPIETMPRLR